MSLVEILWPPFALALLLVFIHAIFGLEIIKRGVIFTDLAIGQSAAVGMAVSITLLNGAAQTELTFIFALAAALLISFASRRVRHIEAFIGLLYALGISSIMLILSQSGEGLELFNRLNASDILFTSPSDVFKVSLLYLALAALMLGLYPRLSGALKDTLFFTALAVTVTSSVQYAGVLVVFALLIAPAYAAMTQTYFKPPVFAWLFGAVSVLFALTLSYLLDLPTGYTIVAATALFSLLSTLFTKR